MRCRTCPRRASVKGLCRRCYYYARRNKTDYPEAKLLEENRRRREYAELRSIYVSAHQVLDSRS